MWSVSRKFAQLPRESMWFVLQSALILPVTYGGLELFGFKRLLAGVERIAPVTDVAPVLTPHDFHKDVRTYTHLFSATARRCPLPLKCLGRSVALCWLLRLQGMDATVHIGVRKEDTGLNAHAWVQIGDLVINDAEDVADHYARVIPSYSGIDRGL